MKKRTIFSALILVLFSISLVACKSSSAISGVKNFMKASVEKDTKTFQQVIQYSQYKDKDMDKLMEEVSEMVKDMGGIDGMEFKEYSKSDLKDDAVKSLENLAGEDFKIVTMKGNNKEFSWILKKMDGKYYIIEGQEAKIEEILK